MKRAERQCAQSPYARLDARQEIELAQRLAKRQTDCVHEAQDLAQDAWLHSWLRSDLVQKPKAWFAAVIRNLRINAYAQGLARSDHEALSVQARTAPPSDQPVLQQEFNEIVQQELAEIKPKYARALRLRYLEEYSTQEVAAALNIPLETARTWIKRGREQLAKRLERRSKGSPTDLMALGWLGALQGGPGGPEALRSPSTSVAWSWGGVSTIAVSCMAMALLVRSLDSPVDPQLEPLVHLQGSMGLVPDGAPVPTGPPPQRPAVAVGGATRVTSGPGSSSQRAAQGTGPSWSVAGRVRDEFGQGIGGALLLAQVGETEFELTRTDQSGAYSAQLPTEIAMVWAEAEGFECGQASFVHDPRWGSDEARRIPLVLRRTSAPPFAATVFDHRGIPIHGATVLLRYRSEEVSWNQDTMPLSRAVSLAPRITDALGRITAPSLEGNLWDMEVSAAGHAPLRRRISREELAGGHLRIEMTTEASLRGRLLLADDTPAPAAPIAVTDALGNRSLVVSGEDGSYSIDGLPAGLTSLFARSGSGVPEWTAQVQWELDPGESKAVDLQLAPGGFVSGAAVDIDGRPLAQWLVMARPVHNGPALQALMKQGPPPACATTDARGQFHLALPKTAHWISLHDPHTGRECAAARVVPGDGDQLTLALGKPSALVGGLLPSAEVEGASLWLFRPSWSSPMRIAVDPSTGRFASADLAPGRYRLLLWPRFGGPRSVGMWLLKPGETTETGMLGARLRQPLHVQALDSAGRILPGKRVTVVDGRETAPHKAHRVIAEAKTDAEGFCVFENLPETPLLLRLGFGVRASSVFPVPDGMNGPLAIQEPPMQRVPIEAWVDSPVHGAKRWVLSLEDASLEPRLVAHAAYAPEAAAPLRRTLHLPVGTFQLTCRLGDRRVQRTISVPSLDQPLDTVVLRIP